MVLFLTLLILFEMKFWLVISMFFSLYGAFFFLHRSPVTRFIFLLFLREKKETVILVKGFRIKKNYILSKNNARKPWVLMRLVKIRK